MTCLAACCSVLQCVAVCCSVLQCVAVCCYVAACQKRGGGGYDAFCNATRCNMHNATKIVRHARDSIVSRSVLQCVAVCCSVLQRVAVCCSVLQCVAVCCSVLLRACNCVSRM